MDLTLKQLNDKIDYIYDQFEEIGSNYMENKLCLVELQSIERTLCSMYKKVINVHNICSNKIDIYTEQHEKINTCDKSTVYLNNIVPYNPFKNITCDIPINVKIVNNIDEIPNTQLYWVENINQFAFHLNGIIFRGNIGNIFNKNCIKKNNQINQTVICKYRNNCKILLSSKKCKFYHDPVELLELLNDVKISKETYNMYKYQTRDYINTSWIYTELPYNKNNIMMRHFGSKNTLKHDCDLMKINNTKTHEIEIDNYRQQTMHDILVIMGLKQCGLLSDYHDISSRSEFYDDKNVFSLLSGC